MDMSNRFLLNIIFLLFLWIDQFSLSILQMKSLSIKTYKMSRYRLLCFYYRLTYFTIDRSQNFENTSLGVRVENRKS